MAIEIIFLLFFVGLAAGFVDTIAGGGGMITLPALILSGINPNEALATNKLQGCVGTCSASLYFIRRGHIKLKELKIPIFCCVIGSALGTFTVSLLSKEFLQKVLPLVLLMIAIILISMPKLGATEQKARLGLFPFALSALIPIGFYDGFLGPGTGSFFLLALLSLRGLTLKQGTIEAKIYNATTNVTSLFVFLFTSKIYWLTGFIMSLGQIFGTRLGAKMVISKGNNLIRPCAILVSVIMSLVLMYRYWF